MEVLLPPLSGYKRIFAGSDYRLKELGSLCIVSCKQERLACNSVGEALGDLHCTCLVGRILPFVEVGKRLLTLLGAPPEQVFVRHGVLGVGIAVVGVVVGTEHMVYERGIAPADGEHHVYESAEYAGLRDHPVLNVAHSVLEVVGDKVIVIQGVVESAVGIAYHFVGGIVAEFVDGCTEVVVAVLCACGIHVVTAEVEGKAVGSVGGGGAFRTDIPEEALVGGDEGGFGILVGLVEALHCHDALLGDLETLGVAAREETSCGKSRDRSYKFDFHIHVIFRR